MASNVDELVNELSGMVRKGADDAASLAKAQPERFSRLLDDVADTPERALDALKQALQPPIDWLSVMILVALQLKKICPELQVGVWSRPGWAKGLLLTYEKQVGGVVGSLGLAFSFGGAAADANGFAVIIKNTVELAPNAGALRLTASSTGDGTILIPVSGGGGLQKDGAVQVSAAISYSPPYPAPVNSGGAADTGLALEAGPIAIGGEIHEVLGGELDWKAVLEFPRAGAGGGPEGLAARADFSAILGDLASVIQIGNISEAYRPSIAVAKGKAPAFDLNHRGGA